MQCNECVEHLDAHRDGELDPVLRAAVHEHLAGCSDCARQRDSLLAVSRLLQESLVHFGAPDVLRARIRSAMSQERSVESSAAPKQTRWTRLAAAGFLIAVVSSGSTYAALQHRASAASAGDAILASHIRSLMPGHLVDVASTDQHNVKPWFNGRVDLSPRVPGLDSAGFALVGGRLDYVADRSVAAVVYRRRQHLINVYAWPSAGEHTGPLMSTAHGYNLVRWRRDNVEYWTVSDLNAGELSQFVNVFQGNRGEGSVTR